MKILFLCGGIGKRMFPLTEDKFLIKFLGKTLIEHQLDTAVKSGLNRFIIVANPVNLTRIENIARAISKCRIRICRTGKTTRYCQCGGKNPALAQRGSIVRQPQ